MRRPASQLYVGMPPLMSLLRVHVLPVVNAVMRSLKSTARSGAVRIRFDPAADSIRIRSTKIGFDPNSVLESARTLSDSYRHIKDTFVKLVGESGSTYAQR